MSNAPVGFLFLNTPLWCNFVNPMIDFVNTKQSQLIISSTTCATSLGTVNHVCKWLHEVARNEHFARRNRYTKENQVPLFSTFAAKHALDDPFMSQGMFHLRRRVQPVSQRRNEKLRDRLHKILPSVDAYGHRSRYFWPLFRQEANSLISFF